MASCVTVKNPFTKYVKKRFDNIEHADNDHKLYRGLVLENEMKILLISDSKTDMSIAAMDVNIGYDRDPDDLPGLAHLCEHILPIMRTKAYHEQINDYNNFLSQHGGRSNANVNLYYTNYWFNIIPEKLKEALDQFAQFFIAPLFDETLIENVIKGTIHSKYNEELMDDKFRFMGLEKFSIKPDHPYSKFILSSKETLDNIYVKNRLEDFYKKYYSANIMSLCILGKDGLDDLQNMVVECFHNVKNEKVGRSYFEHLSLKDEYLNTILYYVPICDFKQLRISFCFSKNLYEHRMPLEYIEHLFKHESEGSLSSALKARGWCNSIVAENDFENKNIPSFTVIIALTEKGINYVEDIVQLMFQYINMLKENGPQEWIYKEIQEMSKINNSYNENKHRLSHEDISRIARWLHECPMEKIFSEQRVWQPDLIKKLIEKYFTPQNIRIYVASKTYESTENETEKWYDVKFKKQMISKETMKMWNLDGYSPDLKLPPKNEFIPKKLDIKINIVSRFIPIIIMDTSFVRVWHEKDDKFYVPKAMMTFHFVSPFAYMDPISFNLTQMFVYLLRESLKKYTHIAKLAGIEWQITGTKYGINMTIDGYDDKQRDLLEKSMDQMINLEIDPKWFETLKEQNIKYFENHDALYSNTENYLEMLLTEQHWLNDELLKSTAYLSVNELKLFIPKLFSQMHVECLIYGNVTEMEAKVIGELIESKLKTRMPHIVPLLQKQLVLYREIKLEKGCHVLFEKENKVLKTSSTIVYYETGLQSKWMLSLLLNQIIKQPCVDYLRTMDKLGYTVFSEICRMMNGTQYLKIFVRGDHPPQYVEERIDLFMHFMYNYISAMSKEQFDIHKKSLNLYLHLTAPNTISSQGSLYWEEIERQEYNFNRVNTEIPYLNEITQQQFLHFYKENVSNELTRRKLSVHVMTTAMAKEMNLPDTSRRITVTSSDNKIKKFDNLMSFKLNQSLYALLEPIDKNVVRKGKKYSSI
ncbi:insulin-degrading enzyme-like [Temnothorax americanus]|uniref:insulin-degrading enzyme-like n=1 Tax=Temnothorax americanus TaxID=1964332 RepID=UPI0040694B2A